MHCKSNSIITAFITSKEVKRESFSCIWKVHKKINENFYILYRFKNDRVIYAPLYIHSFLFLNYKHLTKAQEYLHENPNPEALVTVSDKLKWHRFHNSLLQSEVARAMGVDRTTYSRYEENVLEAYPLDKLSKAAELFGIDIITLLDEYNLFLYQGQGEQIKRLRKAMKLTQSELAKYLDTPLGTLKKWEQNRVSIQKKSFKKLSELLKAPLDV